MSPKDEGFAHLYIPLLVVISVLVLSSSIIPINRNYNDGRSRVEGVAYAKDGEEHESSSGSSGGSSGSSNTESHSEESKSENSGSSNESSGNSSSGSMEKVEEHKTETKTQTGNSSGKSTVRIETESENEKVKVEKTITTTKVKSEIEEGNLKFEFESEDGKVKIKTKIKNGGNETELEAEAENKALDQMEAELEKEDIKIATGSGQIAIINKLAGALTTFPLSVDPTTRELTITTPAGTKVVTVLPQEAIDNLRKSGIVDTVLSNKDQKDFGSVQDLVELEEENGVLGYKIHGTKKHTILGVFPVTTNVDAFVSAENGQVVNSSEPLLGRILTRIGL